MLSKAALLGLASALSLHGHASLTDDTAYTLVQYSGLGCQSSHKMCQHLTKGQCTLTSAKDGDIDFKVYSKLDAGEDGAMTLLACEKAACECTYEQTFTPNECKGGTYGSTSLSYMLVPGEVEGCISYNFDVAGGRHHDAYASAQTAKERFTADGETEEQAPARLLQHTAETVSAPLSDVGGPVLKKKVAAPSAPEHSLASFYKAWGVPAPEQGYEGKQVEHEDFETQTKDWGREYGPNMYGTAATAGVLLAAMLLQ